MRFSRQPDFRRHQVLAVVETTQVALVHRVRGWRGWRMQATEVLAYASPEFSSDALYRVMKEAVARWRVPAGAALVLVVPPLLAGTVCVAGAANAGSADRAAADGAEASLSLPSISLPSLPFPASEILQVPLAADGDAQQCLFWLHRDWLHEFDRLAGQLRLRLAEVFSRVQCLMPPLVAPLPGVKLRGLVEGEAAQPNFHLFDALGRPLRSCALPAGDPLQQARQLAAEWLVAESALGEPGPGEPAAGRTCLQRAGEFPDLDAALASVAADLVLQPVVLPAWALRLEQLWTSRVAGIWLEPPRAELLRDFSRWTVVLGVLGLLLFAGMLWHDDQLVLAIDADEQSLRRNKPAYLKLQEQEAEIIKLTRTLDGLETLAKAPPVLQPLAMLVAQLPAPAWIEHYALNGEVLELSGFGMDAAAAEAMLAAAGVKDLTALPALPQREGQTLAFAWRGRWLPAASVATPAATPAAAPSAAAASSGRAQP